MSLIIELQTSDYTLLILGSWRKVVIDVNTVAGVSNARSNSIKSSNHTPQVSLLLVTRRCMIEV